MRGPRVPAEKLEWIGEHKGLICAILERVDSRQDVDVPRKPEEEIFGVLGISPLFLWYWLDAYRRGLG